MRGVTMPSWDATNDANHFSMKCVCSENASLSASAAAIAIAAAWVTSAGISAQDQSAFGVLPAVGHSPFRTVAVALDGARVEAEGDVGVNCSGHHGVC